MPSTPLLPDGSEGNGAECLCFFCMAIVCRTRRAWQSHLTGAADVSQCGATGLARGGVPGDDTCDSNRGPW